MTKKMQEVTLEMECCYIVWGTVRKTIEIPKNIDPDDYDAVEYVEDQINTGEIDVTDLILDDFYFNEESREASEDYSINISSKKKL